MNYIKNKILYVYDDNGNPIPLYTVNDEIFLTSDKVENIFWFDDYITAVRSKINRIVCKVYKLNSDETINCDISEFVIGLSINMKYNQGITRTGEISLINYNGDFMPSPVKNTFWKGTKLRIDVGIEHNKNIFWKKCGIFVCGTFTVDETIGQFTCPIYDKFANLDGTVSGGMASELQIPRGTKIRKAIQLCLWDNKGNGAVYDEKPIVFPSKYEDATTPYEITKTPGTSVGDLTLELSDIISCDIFYNDIGSLTLEEGSDTNQYVYKATQWDLREDDLVECPTQELDFSKVYNKVLVFGAIENGYQYKAILENTNAQSQNNIYMTDINPLYIEDTNLISDNFCMDRAKYEMKKQGVLAKNIKIKTVFIPNLLPNNVVIYTNKRFGIRNERYIISSITFDLFSGGGSMDITMTNLNEVVFQ